jgi:hypothetical protein
MAKTQNNPANQTASARHATDDPAKNPVMQQDGTVDGTQPGTVVETAIANAGDPVSPANPDNADPALRAQAANVRTDTTSQTEPGDLR